MADCLMTELLQRGYVDGSEPDGRRCEAGDLSCSGHGSITMVTASIGMMAVAEGLRHMLRRMKLRHARARGENI